MTLNKSQWQQQTCVDETAFHPSQYEDAVEFEDVAKDAQRQEREEVLYFASAYDLIAKRKFATAFATWPFPNNGRI